MQRRPLPQPSKDNQQVKEYTGAVKRGFNDYYISYDNKEWRDIRSSASKVWRRRFEIGFFIDDNIRHVEGATRLGISSVEFKSAEQLKTKLAKLGVAISSSIRARNVTTASKRLISSGRIIRANASPAGCDSLK